MSSTGGPDLQHDLRDVLRAAEPDAPRPSAALVEADLARGRRALRQRRARRAGGGLASLALAGVLATAVPLAGHVGTDAPSEAAAPALDELSLVDYSGAQPSAFSVEEVPAGWVVQRVDDYAMVLAPADAQDQDPASYVGKVAVTLGSEDASEPPEGAVAVDAHGVRGVLDTAPDCDPDLPTVGPRGPGFPAPDGACRPDEVPGDPTRTLWAEQPSGDYVLVQVWSGLGWSSDQIADLASGVEVTGRAAEAAG